MKLLVVPNKREEIDKLLHMDIEGIVLGLSNLSVYFNFSLSLEEIKEIDFNNKKLFLSMNKIMHNKDIEYLKSIVEDLKGLKTEGIFISDLGAFKVLKDAGLNVVIDQVHLINNYRTCDYYTEKGASGVVLSNELMLDEIKNTVMKTKAKIFMQVFGYIPMFNSYRKLVSNYFNYIGKEKEEKEYYIYDEKSKGKYRVFEGDETVLYSHSIMNAIDEMKEFEIEYSIINGFGIEPNDLYKVIEGFINGSSYDLMRGYIKNNDKGFLYKECIYKVREHE